MKHAPLLQIASIVLFATGWAQGALAAPPARKSPAAQRPDTGRLIDDTLKTALASAPKATDFPDSDAACLLDLSSVELQADGSVVETVRKAYKLFNQRSRALAEVTLPYNSGGELIQVTAARTVKANGTVVPVRQADIRYASPGEDYAMYNNAVSVGFSLPAIEDNCTIDYSYRKMIDSSRTGNYADLWTFAGPFPVKLSRLIVDAPKNRTVRFRLYNDEICKPVITQGPGGKSTHYVFERRDLKAIVPEPLMPPPVEVASRLELSTYGSWAEVAKSFQSSPSAASKDAQIAGTVTSLTAGKTSDVEKAKAIYDWVVKNVRYVGVDLNTSGYRPHPASEVFSKRYGDAKDKTNLLIAMLGSVGIHAERALLSAGSQVNLEERLPSGHAFNHCIAVAPIDGHDVWLDSTAPTCPYGDIPQADRGAYALVMTPGKPAFRRVPPYRLGENGVEDRETIDLQEDGSARITDTVVLRGNFAQGVRASMRSITPAQREDAAKRMIQMVASGSILKDYTLPDGFDRSGHVEMRFSLVAPQFAQQAGDLLLVPFTAAVKPQNPFLQESRTYPFEQPVTVYIRGDVTITIPKGYEISRMPASVTLSSPLNEQRLTFVKAADGRSLTISAQTDTKQGAAPAEALKKLQDYYNQIIKVSAEKIVLKKIGA